MKLIEYVPYGGGNPVKMFTGPNYAASLKAHSTISVDGLNAGDWYIPGLQEFFEIFSQMNLNGNDPINATFKACGSSVKSLTVARCTPSRFSNNGTWCFGTYGYINNNSFPLYGTSYTCAVATLNL
jgi:hypothetical protein